MQQSNEIDFEAIKSRISISDVLGGYCHVPNRLRYRIPCPLHSGVGLNFAVDDDKGLYHCFVCGAAGDVVSLYAALEGLTNFEAGKRLSEKFQVPTGHSMPLRSIVRQVEQYRAVGTEQPEVVLPPSRPLSGYRKYSQEAIKHFDLRLTDDGVLIPLRDINGRLVGWSERRTYKTPKYDNNTGLKKSQTLYGLYENLEAIKQTKEVILVEGQFDAVRCWDQGLKRVVSSMGAGLSAEQARLLMPFVSKIIVLYDGDEKGRKEAQKIKELYSSMFRIEVLSLPDGEDPDSSNLEEIWKLIEKR